MYSSDEEGEAGGAETQAVRREKNTFFREIISERQMYFVLT